MGRVMVLERHGFMKHRSTTTQLIDTYSDISRNLDSGSQTDIIFLDFAKAFDPVPHDLIVHKLKTFGFASNLLQRIENYLQGRYQSVMIEGQVSSPFNCNIRCTARFHYWTTIICFIHKWYPRCLYIIYEIICWRCQTLSKYKVKTRCTFPSEWF